MQPGPQPGKGRPWFCGSERVGRDGAPGLSPLCRPVLRPGPAPHFIGCRAGAGRSAPRTERRQTGQGLPLKDRPGTRPPAGIKPCVPGPPCGPGGGSWKRTDAAENHSLLRAARVWLEVGAAAARWLHRRRRMSVTAGPAALRQAHPRRRLTALGAWMDASPAPRTTPTPDWREPTVKGGRPVFELWGSPGPARLYAGTRPAVRGLQGRAPAPQSE